jgi:hypothetical protein
MQKKLRKIRLARQRQPDGFPDAAQRETVRR